MMSKQQTRELLVLENLEKQFISDTSWVDTVLRRKPEPLRAVDGVSLDLSRNEAIGVIGESGCGKTTLLKTIAGLYDDFEGEIRYKGTSIDEFSKSERAEYQQDVQFIFQDPFNSMNPKMTVEEIIKEPLVIHDRSNKEEKIREALANVELDPPGKYLSRHLTGLSGGERQRASIARAIVLEPSVILADEPVSMLDVSTQASILNLLSNITEHYNMSMIYISHDLSTISYVCDDICVMYLGRIVERGRRERILQDPKHPYTRALINAVPIPDPTEDRSRTQLEGAPPDPTSIGKGCRFSERCPEKMDVCEHRPRMVDVGSGDHQTACHLYYEDERAGSADSGGA